MNGLDIMSNRKSIRKFKEEQVPLEHIEEMIEAAGQAPSGKNLQNWHFVVLRNKEKIKEIASIIEKKHIEVAELSKDEAQKDRFMKFMKYHIAFQNAPTVVFAYAGPYPLDELDILKACGGKEKEIKEILSVDSRIQNVSAAMENLLLAATAKGYGACWMTGFGYAKEAVEKAIGWEKEGYDLVALTPIGVPEKPGFDVPRKPVEKIMTVIE